MLELFSAFEKEIIIGRVIIDFFLDAWDWFRGAANRLTGVQFVLLLAITYLAFDRSSYALLASSIAAFVALVLLDYRLDSQQDDRAAKLKFEDEGIPVQPSKARSTWLRMVFIGTTAALVAVLILQVTETWLALAMILLALATILFIVLWKIMAIKHPLSQPQNNKPSNVVS